MDRCPTQNPSHCLQIFLIFVCETGVMGIRLIAMTLAPITRKTIGCREPFYGYLPSYIKLSSSTATFIYPHRHKYSDQELSDSLRIFFLTNQKQITCITTVATQDTG